MKSPPTAPPAAYTVDEFCSAHRFTRQHLNKLRKIGQAPKMMKLGRRILISVEAAAEWRKQMEGGAQ